MRIIDLLVTRPSPHPEAPTRPFTPEMLQVKERTSIPYPFAVFTLDSQSSPSRSLRVHHIQHIQLIVKLVNLENPYFLQFNLPKFLIFI
jgi:hypothetical protein